MIEGSAWPRSSEDGPPELDGFGEPYGARCNFDNVASIICLEVRPTHNTAQRHGTAGMMTMACVLSGISTASFRALHL